MRKFLSKFLLFIFEKSKDHRVFFAIISFLCSIWFPIIIKYLGKQLVLIDINESLTVLGWIITIFLYLITLPFLIANAYCLKYTSDTSLLVSLKENIYNICNNKYETLVKTINNLDPQLRNVPTIISDPEKQLKLLREQLWACIKEVTSLKKEDISVSFIYKLNYDKNWRWIGLTNVTSQFREKIIADKNSSFNEALLDDNGVSWHNDKQEAFHDNKFISKGCSSKGSIYCKRIVLDTNVSCATLVVCISTKKNLARSGNDFESELVFKNLEYIMYEFEKRIQIETALLYISEIKKAQKR